MIVVISTSVNRIQLCVKMDDASIYKAHTDVTALMVTNLPQISASVLVC